MQPKLSRKKLRMSSDSKLAIVDADVLVYRTGFTTEDEPEGIAKARMSEWLEKVMYIDLGVEDFECHLTGKTNFRDEVAVTVPYKGNRVDLKKPKHYQALREHLITKYGATVSEGIEADDRVAIRSTELLDNCWIVHVDKDLDQLQGHHFNPVKVEKYYISEFDGYFNFYKQVLTGDRIDNIVGLKGIGPVKAEKALADCKTDKEMFKVCYDMYIEKGETWERLLENAKLLFLLRYDQQIWCPPLSLQDVSGKST
jgi:hypothetical protein